MELDINLYYDDKNPDNNIIENPLHLFTQEIELALKVAPNELAGFRYNMDLEKYVFNQYLSLKDIQEEIASFISNYCSQAKNFQYEITAELMELDNEKFLYILAKVKQGSEYITQKFLLA